MLSSLEDFVLNLVVLSLPLPVIVAILLLYHKFVNNMRFYMASMSITFTDPFLFKVVCSKTQIFPFLFYYVYGF